MKVEIDIDDYLSYEEKKELCVEYVRNTLRGKSGHEERVLSNMAYSCAFAILDSVLTPEMMDTIRNKVEEVISDPSKFEIFRRKDAWGAEDSPAYIEVVKAINEHKHLINPIVKKMILERDYLKDLPNEAEYIGEILIDALGRGLSGGKI